jgi:predicted  nucleic acid-binding Zn-ribbon protein
VDEASLSPEAARMLGVPQSEISRLARPDGRVPLEAISNQRGATMLELARELAHAREEVGRLSGQLKEVRATNLRLQKEIKEGAEERRRLTEEVLELRAASEERLMLMERIEHVAGIEQILEEVQSELATLRNRRLLARILNRKGRDA